ncbi:four-carbon acid sugar kinase family protein [Curtobacterium caseinilyticum]|uniref:Four-carbon acid sugar kinase family protein n=1 Tax=Curtobacterium caseinilyticum TaxID=3055137 RepID=A0ABT7TNX0_9MICO|nr:four-carbon acid sugar kinase family protein [Curtobacterium caseinilyticum]MDM7891296.1 four-carbon acid sugar kinase family protein [Curtobacterium caseinilyticum]
MSNRLAAIADDLSGAAEVAAVLGSSSATVALTLSAALEHVARSSSDVVLDCDTRSLDPDSRRASVARAALRMRAAGAPVRLVKTDSLLRGGVGDVVGGLTDAGAHVVVASALPALGRTVVDGRLLVHGSPVADAGLHGLEARVVPGPLAAVGERARSVPLTVVRAGGDAVSGSVERAIGAGEIPVLDAVTDDDLDRIAAALDGTDCTVVGSGGIAAAVGRLRGAQAPVPVVTDPGQHSARAEGRQHVLLVVGTASTEATGQLEVLAANGVPVVPVPRDVLLRAVDRREVDDIDHPAIQEALVALRSGSAALCVEDRHDPVPHLARRLADGLGIVAAAISGRSALVLTGGETARSVLSRLEIATIVPEGAVEPGCVVSRADDGRRVVTRPGSFGSITNLLDAATFLRSARDDPSATRAASKRPQAARTERQYRR